MMRFGFVTCVQLGLSCMEEILSCGGSLHVALTLHDDLATLKSGRVFLDSLCEGHGIPLRKIRNINDGEALQYLRDAALDWLFIIGWSQIARETVLSVPTRGILGIHPTLLPEGRGRAAIPWAILKGLDATGVTLFQLDAGVDTGPILAQERLPLSPRETATSLYARVNEAHRTLIRRIWADLASGSMCPVPQDSALATTWGERKPEDGRMDPSFTLLEADRMVRAVTHPYPGAFIDTPEGTLRIWAGQPAEGSEIPGGARRLLFADGLFDATDWAMEPFPAQRRQA